MRVLLLLRSVLWMLGTIEIPANETAATAGAFGSRLTSATRRPLMRVDSAALSLFRGEPTDSLELLLPGVNFSWTTGCGISTVFDYLYEQPVKSGRSGGHCRALSRAFSGAN